MRYQNFEKAVHVPYNDLYIYHFKGHLKPDYNMPNNNIKDPGFIGNWEEDEFSFLFFSRPSHTEVKRILSTQSQLTFLDQFHFTYDEWHGERPAPFKAGRFLIAPPWEDMNTCKENLPIFLDPGVVFGTGTHPTTRDCLEALEMACSEEKPESVIDLGTGTGLLAIAAACLGCKYTLAADINFLSATTAEKNIRLNRLEDKILVVQGKAEDFINFPADLVIANIHYDVMKNLINSEGFLEKKMFILSGLLRSQAENVACKLSQYPVKILKKWVHDGIWHTFFGKIS